MTRLEMFMKAFHPLILGSGYLDAHNTDSYMSYSSSLNIGKSGNIEVKCITPNVHHLEAKFQNVAFNLQVHTLLMLRNGTYIVVVRYE
ncbi:autophagy-related protein 2 [Iris pallida]|uniref:Autophagy-related protein 2 n=1 Tax=Iris pallida TaxID=29817 RepID=A0AAX6GRZ6_IRIPA|nr:autophagy-related protein 2 [Iris pallida]